MSTNDLTKQDTFVKILNKLFVVHYYLYKTNVNVFYGYIYYTFGFEPQALIIRDYKIKLSVYLYIQMCIYLYPIKVCLLLSMLYLSPINSCLFSNIVYFSVLAFCLQYMFHTFHHILFMANVGLLD